MPATLLLSESLADSLVNAVERGVPIETAVQAAGITHTTFYEWLKVAESGRWSSGDPVSPESLRTISAFAARVRAAQAKFEASLIESIAAAGSVVGKSGVPEWRAHAWIANNHPRYRERYRQHREVTLDHTGQVTHEHKLVKTLSNDDLMQAAQALDALPPSQP